MKDLKLTIELLPKGAWNNDFSKTLPKKEWDIVRNACYKRANHRCQICGFATDDLDAHEVWDFNIETKTQTLVDILALCSKCHGVKHYRNSVRLGHGEEAKQHFINVNKCSELDYASHLIKAQMDFEEKNKIYRWKMVADLDKFGGESINIKDNYIPLINSLYTQEDLEELKNECDFTPRILDIIVNNYEGTITVICDKTNKIEWIGDDILETKYNFSNTFKTKFLVKNLKIDNIYFKLYGEYGEKVSKKFDLIPYDFADSF